MKIYHDTKIFIMTMANIHTGGVELLHQLCSQLLQFGLETYLVYYELRAKDPVDSAYRKYHLPYVEKFIDEKHNILIIPESRPNFLYFAKKCQRVLWWMSVDNFISNTFKRMLASPLTEPFNKNFIFAKKDSDIDHWVQSEYARQFIKLNGIEDKKIYFVGDYLNQAFLSRFQTIDFSAKENWVAYNPRKGFQTTSFLMKILPDINWKPIQNMTAEQVQELLAKCKIYIDFGEHPGKDRIPREAALQGCVIITGKDGSAGNDIDINIPAEFKFDDRNLKTDAISKKFQDVFENFDTEFAKQADYRNVIQQERKKFTEDVAKVCDISPNAVEDSVAIFNLNSKAVDFAKFFIGKKSKLVPRFVIDDKMAPASGVLTVDLDDKHKLEVISVEDAKFLCLEGRIRYLAIFSPSEEQVQEIKNNFAIPEENLLIINR